MVFHVMQAGTDNHTISLAGSLKLHVNPESNFTIPGLKDLHGDLS